MNQKKISEFTTTLQTISPETPSQKTRTIEKRNYNEIDPTTPPSPKKYNFSNSPHNIQGSPSCNNDQSHIHHQKLLDDIHKIVEDVIAKQTTEIEEKLLTILKDHVDTKVNQILETTKDDLEQKIKLDLCKQFDQKINSLENSITEQKKMNSNLLKRIVTLEENSTKNNLRFFNIKYTSNENFHSLQSNILQIINSIGFRLPPIAIAMVRRSDVDSSVIVQFHHIKDRNYILSNSKSIYMKTKISISEDLPSHILQIQKQLYPIVKTARKLKYRAHLSYDQIVVSGRSYSSSQLDQLPQELHPHKVTTIKNQDMIAFYHKLSPLSNHYHSKFLFDGKEFNCSEQAYLFTKANAFGCADTANCILNEPNPSMQKRLSKSLNKSKEQEWSLVKEETMQKILYEKFAQNPKLKQFLLETNDDVLIEANPHDRFWGAGININNPDIWKKSTWTGSNRLGQILMFIRNQFKNNIKQ